MERRQLIGGQKISVGRHWHLSRAEHEIFNDIVYLIRNKGLVIGGSGPQHWPNWLPGTPTPILLKEARKTGWRRRKNYSSCHSEVITANVTTACHHSPPVSTAGAASKSAMANVATDCHCRLASDKFIAENSTFLHNLQPRDLVLADRGFSISDSVKIYCAEVKYPAFLKENKTVRSSRSWDN